MRTALNWWDALSLPLQLTIAPLVASAIATALVIGLLRPSKLQNADDRAADAEYARRLAEHEDGVS